MSVHSCCCIIFCIAWFEVGFRIELKLYFELLWEKLKRNKFPFSFLSPAFGPLGFALPLAQLATGLSFLYASPASPARFSPLRAAAAQFRWPIPFQHRKPHPARAPSTADSLGPVVRLLLLLVRVPVEHCADAVESASATTPVMP